MTTPSLSVLLTPLTRDQILASILQIAEELELPVEAWQDDGIVRIILTLVAESERGFSVGVVPMAQGGLLSWANGAWLSLNATDNFDVSRIEATSGTTDVVLTNSTGIAYPVQAGDLRFYNVDPQSGANYTSTTGGTIPAFGNLTVTVEADQPGTGSNAAIGQITGMTTPIQGVSCTNPAPLVGIDEETDAALRERCRESFARVSPNGPRDAYDYFAKTTTKPDGSNVGVTRTAVNQANGTVTVYVASASGTITGSTTPINNGSDLDLVNLNIQNNVVPTGITAFIATAQAVVVPITCTVYLSPGSTLDSGQATALIQAQLLAYFSTIPIGGFNIGLGGQVLYDALIGQIYNASNQFITVTLTAPVGDVPLAAYQVATLGNLTVTVVASGL